MGANFPLTEAVYYILLSLKKPMHGYGIMQNVEKLSGGRAQEEGRAGELTQQVSDLRVALAQSRTESESTVTGIAELEALISSAPTLPPGSRVKTV